MEAPDLVWCILHGLGLSDTGSDRIVQAAEAMH